MRLRIRIPAMGGFVLGSRFPSSVNNPFAFPWAHFDIMAKLGAKRPVASDDLPTKLGLGRGYCTAMHLICTLCAFHGHTRCVSLASAHTKFQHSCASPQRQVHKPMPLMPACRGFMREVSTGSGSRIALANMMRSQTSSMRAMQSSLKVKDRSRFRMRP